MGEGEVKKTIEKSTSYAHQIPLAIFKSGNPNLGKIINLRHGGNKILGQMRMVLFIGEINA